jgi:hypothetical protein
VRKEKQLFKCMPFVKAHQAWKVLGHAVSEITCSHIGSLIFKQGVVVPVKYSQSCTDMLLWPNLIFIKAFVTHKCLCKEEHN